VFLSLFGLRALNARRRIRFLSQGKTRFRLARGGDRA
jgi:hypothetical protein